MGLRDRDEDVDIKEELPREKPRRSRSERKPGAERDSEFDQERDRDRDREHREHKDRDRPRRHRSSRTSRTGADGSETHSYTSTHRRRRHHRDKDSDKEGSRDDLRERLSSASDLLKGVSTVSLDRPRMPYPSFSKAHSKEAVVSREDLGRRVDPLTPEPTDVGDRQRRSSDAPRRNSTSKESSRPPSPPETDVSPDKGLSADPAEAIQEADETTTAVDDEKDYDDRSESRGSGLSRSGSHGDDKSKTSRATRASSQATFVKSPAVNQFNERTRSDSRTSSLSREAARRSASNRGLRPEPIEVHSSPSSVQDSSPKTPTQPQSPNAYSALQSERDSTLTPDGNYTNVSSKAATPAPAHSFPPPPPPPPPVIPMQEPPRVDYLLQNGGLPCPAPKSFLSVLPRQNSTRAAQLPLAGADVLFAPFYHLLEQYNTVLNRQGSVAVATGHRSVARRLLDRLENVFSRDLPSHGCSCIMCDRSYESHRGLTWGDVLEWVSGRIELPSWPPFDLAEIGTKAAEVSAEEPQRPRSPVKLDPDIAEEFREHYLRQSKKVRSAVDSWLNKTGETPVPPPQDVDDETLSFAILTSLDIEDRPYYNALLTGAKELKPGNRAPTPMVRSRNDFLIKSGLALQRLYRLSHVPRDAESAVYLVRNPHTHDLLVSLSNISNSEWEILTSGRFDGFLWSGAEGNGSTPAPESRGTTPVSPYTAGRQSSLSGAPRVSSAMGSRTTTPFSSYSRGATPASFISNSSSTVPVSRQPVSHDEEMEMAALAEIEREIYTGMEVLEDAFERLHHKAETVREALRSRGTGLMQNFQHRRSIDVLTVPLTGNSQGSGYERPPWAVSGSEAGSDSEWGMDDQDIMPDDSASNISSSRHRRPKRRTERRTPAPIEEDEEE